MLRYFAVVGGAFVSILLFLLASASDNSGFFDRYYAWLLGLNAAVAGALLLLVAISLYRLYSRYKEGKFGAKLMTRLVLLFAAIGVLPGLVIFLVSVQFVSHSIDSWFNVLTRQYTVGITGSVAQSYSSLDDALFQIRRPNRWIVAPRGALKVGETYTVKLSMGLDPNYLPKPIQLNALNNNNEWRLASDKKSFLYKAE